MMAGLENPYLKKGRLGDVISAIQVMGSNEVFLARTGFWAERLAGTEDEAKTWEAIFGDHRNFFVLMERPAQERGSTRWSGGTHLPYLNRTTGQEVSDAEYRRLSAIGGAKIGRRQLRSDELKILTDMAITLHAKAVEQSRDWRWWVAPALSLAGSFAGAVLAFVAAAFFKH